VALGAGLALRLAWCLYAARPPVGLHDPSLYRFLAQRLVDGHGYSYGNGPTAYYPPLLPFLLAGPLWVVDLLPGVDDPATIATVVLNLGLSAAAIALAWRLGRVLGGPPAAAGAALLLALWPNLVVHTALPLTETPTLVIVLGLAVLLVERLGAAEVVTAPRLVAIGAVLGLGLLLRPVLLPVIAAVAMAWWRAGVGWRLAVRRAAAVAVVAAAVCLPWVVRNAVQVDTVALTLNTGDNLCIGHQPGADGTFRLTEHCFPSTFDEVPRPDSEIQRDERNRRQALEHLRGHLVDEPEQVARRAWATVEDDHDGLRAVESFGEDRFLPSWARRGIGLLSDGWYVLAVLAGVVLVPRALRAGDRRGGAVLLLGVASVLAPLATFGEPRFKVPAVPLLCVLLAVGAVGRPSRAATPAEPPPELA
jgi:4-amino-4-deoxy-L-arabinose transferase-like glycosyltransferase